MKPHGDIGGQYGVRNGEITNTGCFTAQSDMRDVSVAKSKIFSLNDYMGPEITILATVHHNTYGLSITVKQNN